MSSEYNKEHLFGSDEFIERIKNQAKLFIDRAKKSELFDSARFAKVDIYKFDCEARFYWGDGESSRYVVLLLGSDQAIKLKRNENLKYDDACINGLRVIADDLGWRVDHE